MNKIHARTIATISTLPAHQVARSSPALVETIKQADMFSNSILITASLTALHSILYLLNQFI